MIKWKNKWFPFPGFSAITIWPFIFYKGEISESILNHELIHARQQKELLLVGFYLVYLVEWVFKGYDRISFEKEAYAHEADDSHLKTRKLFQMWRK
jgi:hypothetical protein